ncbi:hypothetical protein AC1031_000691 [Aphanomyces cochlioides]|nr:hypothetical protein AC1031_000691 [Aphanomyces cochlioides]
MSAWVGSEVWRRSQQTLQARQAAQPVAAPPQRLRGSQGTPGNPASVPPDDDDAGTSEDVDMALGVSFASATGNGRVGRTDGSETSVDPFSSVRLRPFMDTQNSQHPFYMTGSVTLDTSTGTGAVKEVGFRLNSIFDVRNDPGYTADPTPAADVADAAGSIDLVIMRDFWASIYRYWTVVHSKHRIRVWTQNTDDQEADIWNYHHGQQAPPLVSSTSNSVIYSKYRRLHRHAHYKTLQGHASTSTEKDLFKREVVFEGEYRMGNETVVNDVSEDEYK